MSKKRVKYKKAFELACIYLEDYFGMCPKERSLTYSAEDKWKPPGGCKCFHKGYFKKSAIDIRKYNKNKKQFFIDKLKKSRNPTIGRSEQCKQSPECWKLFFLQMTEREENRTLDEIESIADKLVNTQEKREKLYKTRKTEKEQEEQLEKYIKQNPKKFGECNVNRTN
jgi:hypothetical protein